MNSDLKHLIRLQSVDLSIQEIRSRIDKFPSQTKALDDEMKAATAAVDSVRERIKNNQAGRKKSEGDVSSLESKISKYREQMMAVKTNEEYRAIQKEIEFTQTSIRQVEDGILKLMEEAESLQTELRAAETRLKEDQRLVQEERKKLDQSHQQDVSAVESYLQERREIEKSVSADLLFRYERVKKARGGVAVATAADYVCGVCKVRMRPQVFEDVRRNDQIISCDSCQRILYFAENLDHPFEIA